MEHADRTLLIVEDSPIQTELLRRALEGAGFKVIAAREGAEGLELAKARRPDAVVSDINMPLMDGYALCRAIRADASLQLTPFILLTMLSDPQDVIRGLNAGADAYVTKPYNIPALVARIDALLAGPPVATPKVERRKLEVRLAGQDHVVDANGPRMLNLLISTYENAVLQNRELLTTQQALEELNENLEEKVREKTAEVVARERRFRALIENGADLVIVADAAGRMLFVSPSVTRIGGYDPGELLGKPVTAFVHPEDARTATERLRSAVANPGQRHTAEIRCRTRAGNWVVLDAVATNALGDPAVAGIVINARDITERKFAEDEMRRLNRALTSIHACSAALVRANDETGLVTEICALLVSQGGFDLAWVGECRKPGAEIRVLSSAGRDGGFLRSIEPDLKGAAPGQERLADIAMRSGEAILCEDLATDPLFAPWRKRALEHGLASAIALPLAVGEAPFGVLELYAREPGMFDAAEVRLLHGLAGDLAYGLASRRTRRELDRAMLDRRVQELQLRKSLEDSIRAVAATVEARDPYTAGHQRRVAELASAVAEKLGLSRDEIDGLRLGCIVHDLGKVHIPAEILSKPGRLSPIEYELVQSHSLAGYEILSAIDFPWPIAEMVYQHHERLDGSGYPRKLKGEQIIIQARILAVTDTVEAMSAHRPYRPALGIDKALAEIERGRGTLYDPDVVDACLEVFREGKFSFAS